MSTTINYFLNSKFSVHGISHENNHAVIKQMLALKYFVQTFNYTSERVELFDIIIPKLKESLSEVGPQYN